MARIERPTAGINSVYWPVLVVVLLILGSLWVWYGAFISNKTQLTTEARSVAIAIAGAAESRFFRINEALERLAARGAPVGGITAEQWDQDARFYVESFAGMEQILWVDTDFRVHASFPPKVDVTQIGAPAEEISAGLGELLVWVPSYAGRRFAGYVLGTVALQPLFEDVWGQTSADHMFVVEHDGSRVYTTPNWNDEVAHVATTAPLSFRDSTVLSLTIAATDGHIRTANRESRRTLIWGIALALFGGAAVFLAQNFNALAILAELRYRSVFEASKDAIFLIDPHGTYLDANPAALTLCGYSLSELRQMGTTDLAAPGSSPSEEGPVPEWRDGGSFEVELRHKDGHDIPVELVVSPLGKGPSRQAVLGIARDIRERKDSDRKLRAALERSELLIRELYHRTKNNLQVIVSMLGLQAMRSDSSELKTIFAATQYRIQSMALVHQKLYQSQDLSRIRLDDYVRSLVELLMSSYSVRRDRVSVDFDLSETTVLIDTAVPCGLILNELVSNALKHGFPGDREGKVLIGLRQNGKQIDMVVADNGIGAPDGFSLHTAESFGLQAVVLIAEQQLQGTLTYECNNGLHYRITFCDDLYEERV